MLCKYFVFVGSNYLFFKFFVCLCTALWTSAKTRIMFNNQNRLSIHQFLSSGENIIPSGSIYSEIVLNWRCSSVGEKDLCLFWERAQGYLGKSRRLSPFCSPGDVAQTDLFLKTDGGGGGARLGQSGKIHP